MGTFTLSYALKKIFSHKVRWVFLPVVIYGGNIFLLVKKKYFCLNHNFFKCFYTLKN